MKIKSEEILSLNRRLSEHEIYKAEMSNMKQDNMLASYARALKESEREVMCLVEFLKLYHGDKINKDLTPSENIITILVNEMTGCKIDDKESNK